MYMTDVGVIGCNSVMIQFEHEGATSQAVGSCTLSSTALQCVTQIRRKMGLGLVWKGVSYFIARLCIITMVKTSIRYFKMLFQNATTHLPVTHSDYIS